MYLDTAEPGNVTVGIGHLLSEWMDAIKLPFVLRAGLGATPPIAATKQEISKEFAAIAAQRPAMAAGYYKAFGILQLTDPAIDALLESDIAATEQQLVFVPQFAQFASFVEPAQDGTLDMAFNLGVRGLVTKFPRFTKAASRQDWAACAAECERSGVSPSRNEAVRNLFLQASHDGTDTLTEERR